MVKTVKSYHNEDEVEEDYHDFASIAPDNSSNKVKLEGESGDQKLRSKHSETEQRRRSKINERFQMLRDLIPENDQKRDKASFLLEVIQYIQFLQEKLRIYEGAQQGWSPEPSKLMPWRSNSGPVESFVEQSPLVRSNCNQDDIAVTPTILAISQNSVDSDLSANAVYKYGSADQEIPLDIPLQPNLFECMSAQNQGSLSDVEQLVSHSQTQYLNGKWLTECNTPRYAPNEPEDFRSESPEANFSNAYSQMLLDAVTRALQSSGVDLSQASISMRLDTGKRTNTGTTVATYSTKDHQNETFIQPMAQHVTASKSYDQSHKRLRTEQS